jgi:hypothetical protein
MNIIKLILAAIGLVFVGMLLLWAIGFIGSLLWYLFWIGVLGAIGYGGYRLFRKIEDKALGSGSARGIDSGADIPMSWDEYDRKYLHK